MTNAPSFSSRIYGRLLVLYPADLRRDYGAEMALVFAEDLSAARREAGVRGIIRVWQCALGELFRFALPSCASSPAVRVPAISLAILMVILGCEMVLALRRAPDVPTLFQSVFTAFWAPVFATPLIALAAVCACRGRAVILLNLSGNMGEDY